MTRPSPFLYVVLCLCPFLATPAIAQPAAGLAEGGIVLRPQHQKNADTYTLKRIAFAGPNAAMLAAAYHTQAKGVKRTIIDLVSLAGKASGTLELPNHVDFRGLSPDASMAVVIGNETRVDVWPFPAAGTRPAQPAYTLRPYDGEQESKVVFAAMLAPTRLLTVGQNHRLIVWDLKGPKAEFGVAVKFEHFAISADRTRFAFFIAEERSPYTYGVTVVNLADGKIAATIPGPQGFYEDHLHYSADGKRLLQFIGFPSRQVRVYDLAANKLAAGCSLADESNPKDAEWAGPNHVLAGEKLVDLQKRIVVWNYKGVNHDVPIDGQPDDRYWALIRAGSDELPSVLLPVTLPHDSAKKAIDTANADDQLVIRPGTRVNIELKGIGDWLSKSVREGLTRQVREAGLVVADDKDIQPVRLVATTVPRPGREMRYRTTGGLRGGIQTVSIPSYDCSLQLIKNGLPLWEIKCVAGGHGPQMAFLKPGQTVQQHVDELNANPGKSFYIDAPIPGALHGPPAHVGTSNVTAKGIVAE